jgi:hypothetical protein
MGILVVCVTLLCLAELVIQRALGIISEGYRRLASDHSGRVLAHLLPFQIALKCVKEEPVMRDREPVEDLLFLLCTNTLVLKQEVEER